MPTAAMTPLSDRVVIVALVATIGLVFALVFWTVRLHPGGGEPPLQWRQGATAALGGSWQPGPPELPSAEFLL